MEESPENSLLAGVIVEQDSYPQTELIEHVEEEKLQFSNQKKTFENDEVKLVSEEIQSALKHCEDSQLHKYLSKGISSDPILDELPGPLAASRNLTKMTREEKSELGDPAYLSFIEETADGSSGQNSELVKPNNFTHYPELDHIQHNVEGDPPLVNMSSEDDTMISSFASAQDDNDEKTKEEHKKYLQKSKKVKYKLLSTST